MSRSLLRCSRPSNGLSQATCRGGTRDGSSDFRGRGFARLTEVIGRDVKHCHPMVQRNNFGN